MACVTGPCEAGTCNDTRCHFVHPMPPPPPSPPPPAPPPAVPKAAPGTWFSLTRTQREAFLAALAFIPISIWYGFYRLRKMEEIAKKADLPQENAWGDGDIPVWLEPHELEGDARTFVKPPPRRRRAGPLTRLLRTLSGRGGGGGSGGELPPVFSAATPSAHEEEEEELYAYNDETDTDELKPGAAQRPIQFVELTEAGGGSRDDVTPRGDSELTPLAPPAAAAGSGGDAAGGAAPLRPSQRASRQRAAEEEAAAAAARQAAHWVASLSDVPQYADEDDDETLPPRAPGRLPLSRAVSLEDVLQDGVDAQEAFRRGPSTSDVHAFVARHSGAARDARVTESPAEECSGSGAALQEALGSSGRRRPSRQASAEGLLFEGDGAAAGGGRRPPARQLSSDGLRDVTTKDTLLLRDAHVEGRRAPSRPPSSDTGWMASRLPTRGASSETLLAEARQRGGRQPRGASSDTLNPHALSGDATDED